MFDSHCFALSENQGVCIFIPSKDLFQGTSASRSPSPSLPQRSLLTIKQFCLNCTSSVKCCYIPTSYPYCACPGGSSMSAQQIFLSANYVQGASQGTVVCKLNGTKIFKSKSQFCPFPLAFRPDLSSATKIQLLCV